jgi:hypothetical protein
VTRAIDIGCATRGFGGGERGVSARSTRRATNLWSGLDLEGFGSYDVAVRVMAGRRWNGPGLA